MNLFKKYRAIKEGCGYTIHTSGTGYTAIVSGHKVKFHKNGEHMPDADYEGKGDTKEEKERDAQEFAHDEMEHRKGVKESIESIDETDGDLHDPNREAFRERNRAKDPIERESEEGGNKGRKHAQMGGGSASVLLIGQIASILSKRKKF
jgi:hypothetical protein